VFLRENLRVLVRDGDDISFAKGRSFLSGIRETICTTELLTVL
jgi:hypothetical protein